MSDKYIVRDLQVRSTTIADPSSDERCKVLVNVTVELHVSVMRHMDDNENQSTRYSDICGIITSFAKSDCSLPHLQAFATGIVCKFFNVMPHILAVRALVQLPHAVPNVEYASIDVFHTQKEVFGSWQPAVDLESKDVSENGNLVHEATSCWECEKTLALIDDLLESNRIIIKNLSLCTESGLYFWGRHYKQTVNIDLVFYLERPSRLDIESIREAVSQSPDFAAVVETTVELVENNTFQSVEDMATAISRAAINQCGLNKITVRIAKPRSVVSVSGDAVEITRAAGDFAELQHCLIAPNQKPEVSLEKPELFKTHMSGICRPLKESTKQTPDMHAVYIGVRTNMGDRLGNMHRALHHLRNTLPESLYTGSSFLYESPPARGSDGLSYLDAAVLIRTKLNPLALHASLQTIESKIRHGTAAKDEDNVVISLQILLYGTLEFENDTLTVPHPRLHENRVQLRTLCDFDSTLQHPRLATTMKKLYKRLITRNSYSDEIIQVTQLKTHVYAKNNNNPHKECMLQALNPGQQKKTLFMGMIDWQPDNIDYFDFIYYMSEAFQRVQKLYEGGANIIGICGKPRHPEVEPISVQDEIANTIPLIVHIRNEMIEIPISVETCSADVAAAALDAGADIICDTTGGLADPAMLPLVAKRRCPYVIVHSQDDLYSLSDTGTHCEHSSDIVCKTRNELAERIRAALDHGVARWNIIIDPGVGYARDSVQDFEMLRRFSQFTAKNISLLSTAKTSSYVDLVRQLKRPAKKDFITENLATSLANYPVLFGSSRRSFIDNVTENWTDNHSICGTAAAITAAIQGGASIVQVHDISEMSDVVCVSDYIYRSQH
ncbi:trifunctional dihydropteroate synthetase [Coemansia sp. RSA 2049]|nr:trifunctional dihydropteroate synthetase [Coemansia sp. RSA 2049]